MLANQLQQKKRVEMPDHPSTSKISALISGELLVCCPVMVKTDSYRISVRCLEEDFAEESLTEAAVQAILPEEILCVALVEENKKKGLLDIRMQLENSTDALTFMKALVQCELMAGIEMIRMVWFRAYEDGECEVIRTKTYPA